MSRHFKLRKSISFIISLAMLLSIFCSAVPVWAADPTGAGIYTIATLNQYGGFEVDGDGDGLASYWFFNDGRQGYQVSLSDDCHGGAKSQKLVVAPDSQNSGSVSFDWVPVSDQKQYKITFWAKMVKGTLTFFLYDISNWKVIDDANKPRMDIATTAENKDIWKEYTFIYVPKPTTEYIGVRFANWTESNLEVYIDDVYMEEYVPPTPAAPVIELDNSEEDVVADERTYTVSGTVTDEDGNLASVKVNGNSVSFDSNGSFSADVTLEPGENTITVTAEDSDGQVAEKTIKVTLNLVNSPFIELDQPDNNVVKGTNIFTVSGKINDADDNLDYVEVNGEAVTVESDGSFSKDIPINIGFNKITVVAVDEDGYWTEKEITVELQLDDNQPYDVGIFYFSNWNPNLSPHMIVNTRNTYGRQEDWFGGVRDTLLDPGPWGYGPFPDREPLIGWYDDRQQEVLDTHILQAASRGIDHFAFYYYWKEDGSVPRQGQNVEYFKNSPYRHLMDYYIYFVADGSYNENHWRNNIVPKLIEFMKDPNYKKTKSDDPDMDGRPILGFFGDIKGRLGGTDAKLKAGLQYLRDKCIEAGLKNPLLLVDGYRNLRPYIVDQGFDGFLPLNLAGIGLDDNQGIPEDYASSYPDAWKEIVFERVKHESYEDYLFIPGGLNAFDARPWRGVAFSEEPVYFYADPSPSKFKAQLQNVKDYLDNHESSMNMATFYAWNEWGEGGTIEPNTLFGYGYIDAIQEVFGLKNENYKLTVQDKQLEDIAPDVRISVEPENSIVVEGQDAVLKVRIKNYSDEDVTGTLTLSQPEKNTEGIDQAEWNVKSSTGTNFALSAGEASDAEFVVTVGEGDIWTRHNFEIVANYKGESQIISTFVVKVPPFYGCIERDNSKQYTDFKFDINVRIRNYTMEAKDVNYQLVLPEGWTADKPTGTAKTSGYSGTGVHTNRTRIERVVISYPDNIPSGNYTIKLITSDGEFNAEEELKVYVTTDIGNLLYNGSMELDDNNDGIPDVWTIDGGATVTVLSGTAESPAPDGSKYVKVVGTKASTGHEIGYKQEGTKDSVHWLTIDPNKKYRVGFWAKVEKGKMSVIDCEARGVNYEWLGWNKYRVITAEENGNEWKYYTMDFFPNPKAGRESLRFYIVAEPGEETIFYLDGVSLKEVDLTPEENMVKNGNFETAGGAIAEGWTSFRTGGTFNPRRTYASQYGGQYSLNITGNGADGSYVAQEWFDVDPSKEYVVQFYAKVDNGTFTVVSAEKAGDGGEVTYNTGLDIPANNGEWTKYEHIFKPQAGMTKASLRFVIKGSANSAAYFDNVVFKPYVDNTGVAPEIVLDQQDKTVGNEKFTVSGIVSDADGDLKHLFVNDVAIMVSSDGSFKYKVTLKKGLNTIKVIAKDEQDNVTEKTLLITYVAGTNMVENPGFEEDADSDGLPDAWILSKPASINATMGRETAPSKVYNGSASLKFTAPANTNRDHVMVVEEEFHDVNPEKKYIIEFYARVPSGVIHLFVEEKATEAGNGVRKDMSIDAHQWQHATKWTKFTTEYIPSEGTNYARIVFYNWNEIALEGYVDDVVFKEKPEPIIITFDAGDSDRVTDIDEMNYVVTGKVQSEAEIESVTVNGREISIESDGSFSTVVALNRGANRINVVARNVDSEEVSAELPVFVDLPKKVTSDDVIAEDRENMIVYPHFGTPAFIEPGQTFIAEVAATDVTTSGWTAYIENDLRRWDCTVGEVVYGQGNIYLGMRSGYTIEIQVPDDVSPELFDLVLTHTESGKTFKSPHALSVVPELDTSFYMLGVSDTHMYWFEHANNTVEGGNDGKSYGLMAKVATLGGARYFSHTGDVSLSGAVSRAVGIKDYMIEPAVTMGRVPIVFAPGNHEYDPYVSPIPSTTEGDRTGDFAFEDADRYFGMRSQIIDMGTFALVKSDYGCYWGDRPLRQAMTDVWNAVFGDPECKYTYRLLLQHTHNTSTALFYNGNEAPPIAPYPSLEIKGHNHRYNVDQVNPFLIISQGGGENWKQGTGLFFNFVMDENYNWSCPEATPSYNGSNRVALVKDARNGYDITALRDSYLYANNGTATSNVCTIINEINFNFYDGRVRFEMAQGRYKVTGGTILSQYDYEDERGWHTAVLVDVDIAPNAVTTVSIEQVEGEAPVISLDQEDSTVTEAIFTVSGTVTDADGDLETVTVNGQEVEVVEGAFSVEITLSEGENIITVVATDSEGNTTEKTIKVTYQIPGKPFIITPVGGLVFEGGIKATASISLNPEAETHTGTEVVVFQLMKGDTPVSIIALEKDITQTEQMTAFFNVDPEAGDYTVEVYVFDRFDNSNQSAPIILADRVIIQ